MKEMQVPSLVGWGGEMGWWGRGGRKFPWRKKWQSAPVFLSGKAHGQRSLVGDSPWGHKSVEYDLVTKQQQIALWGVVKSDYLSN